MKITIKTPPISVNQMYRGGRRFLTQKGKDTKESIKWEMWEVWRIPTKERLKVDILIFFDDNRIRDIDNYLKAFIDAGTGTIWEDDSQIDDIRIQRMRGKPRIEMEVIPIIELQNY